jgi:hypothetical protein
MRRRSGSLVGESSNRFKCQLCRCDPIAVPLAAADENPGQAVEVSGPLHPPHLEDLQKAKEALNAKAEALLLALLQGLEVESQPTHQPPCPRCQSPMQQGSAIAPQGLDSS